MEEAHSTDFTPPASENQSGLAENSAGDLQITNVRSLTKFKLRIRKQKAPRRCGTTNSRDERDYMPIDHLININDPKRRTSARDRKRKLPFGDDYDYGMAKPVLRKRRARLDNTVFCHSDCHGGRSGLHMRAPLTSEAVWLMQTTDPQDYCNRRVHTLSCSAVFLFDVSSDEERNDLRRDGYGVWLPSNRKPRQSFCGCQKVDEAKADSYVWRIAMICKSYRALRRTEIYRRTRNADGTPGKLLSPVIISYEFLGPVPDSVTVVPHGNATRKIEPYQPRTKRLQEEIKAALAANPGTPLSVIYEQLKGFEDRLPSDTPRDLKQLYDRQQRLVGSQSAPIGTPKRPKKSLPPPPSEFSQANCHGGRSALHMSTPVNAQAVQLMLTADPQQYCSRRVQTLSCSAVFLYAVSSEDERRDLRRDGYGVWVPSHRSLRQSYCGGQKVADEAEADSYVWRIAMTCKSYRALRRTEIYRRARNADGTPGEILNPVVVSYEFLGPIPESITVVPHGNATRKKEPFQPRTRALLKEVKEAVEANPSATPEKILQQLMQSKETEMPSDVPRDLKQITDYIERYRKPLPATSGGRDTGVDQTIEDEGIMEEVILTSDPPPALTKVCQTVEVPSTSEIAVTPIKHRAGKKKPNLTFSEIKEFSSDNCHGGLFALHREPPSTSEALHLMTTADPCWYNDRPVNTLICESVFLFSLTDKTNRLWFRRDGLGRWKEGHRSTLQRFQGLRRSDDGDTLVWRVTFSSVSVPSLKRVEIYRRRCGTDGDPGEVLSPMLMAYHYKGEPPNKMPTPCNAKIQRNLRQFSPEEFNGGDCHGGRIALHISTPETALAISLMINTESQFINSRRINGVRCNCVFLCHVATEEERLDFRRDGMGTWTDSSRHPRIPYLRMSSVPEPEADSYLWRISSHCKSYPALRRTEIIRRARLPDGSVGELLSPVLMAYEFSGEPPESITILPHGNAKKQNKPFHPCTRTLIKELRQAVASQPEMPITRIYNKEILKHSIDSVTTPGELPRGLKQLYDFRNRLKVKTNSVCPFSALAHVMEEEVVAGERFLRIVDPVRPRLVLFTNDALDFLWRNCSQPATLRSPVELRWLTMGNFRTLVCTVRASEFRGEPLLLGPVLISPGEPVDLTALWAVVFAYNESLHTQELTFVVEGEATIDSVTMSFPAAVITRSAAALVDEFRERLTRLGLSSSQVTRLSRDMRRQQKFNSAEFHSQSQAMYQRWLSQKTPQGLLEFYRKTVEPGILGRITENETRAAAGEPMLDDLSSDAFNALVKNWPRDAPITELIAGIKEQARAQYEELKRGYLGLSQKYKLKESVENSQPAVALSNLGTPMKG